jgi:hypothetical protein
MNELTKECQPIKDVKFGITSVKFIDSAGNHSKYHTDIPKYSDEQISEIQSKVVDQMMKSINKDLKEFFEPYFRSAGIKGEITKGKIKWRGLKMHSRASFEFTEYQLFKRGVAISPTIRINYPIQSVQNENNLIQ